MFIEAHKGPMYDPAPTPAEFDRALRIVVGVFAELGRYTPLSDCRVA